MGELPSAVLFACTMNSVRSPMAEAIFRHLHAHRVYVDSVGVRAREVDSFAVAALDEIGLDLAGHVPKTFEDLEDTFFDVVVSLSPEAQHKAVELTRVMACEVEFWNTFDPSLIEGSREVRLEAYRRVRNELERRIRGRFPAARGVDV